MSENEKTHEELLSEIRFLQTRKESLNTDVFLFDEINEETAENVCNDLLYLAKEIIEDESDEIIRFYINSNGGAIREMAAIIDCMEFVKSQEVTISTIGIGKIYSAGLGILAAGSKGYRRIGRNARLMFHGASAGAHGSIRTLKSELIEYELEEKLYLSILSQYTGKTKSFFEKLLNKSADLDKYLSSKDALKWGLVDLELDFETGNEK